MPSRGAPNSCSPCALASRSILTSVLRERSRVPVAGGAPLSIMNHTSQTKPLTQNQPLQHNPNRRQELIDAGLIRPGREQPPFTPITPEHLAPFEPEPPPHAPRKRRRRR